MGGILYHMSMESVNGVKIGNLNPSIAILEVFRKFNGTSPCGICLNCSEMLYLFKILSFLIMICSASVAPRLA